MSGLLKATANTHNGRMEGCAAREENWQTLAHFVHFRVFCDKITVFLTSSNAVTMFAFKASNDILSIFHVVRLTQSNGRPSFLAVKPVSFQFY